MLLVDEAQDLGVPELRMLAAIAYALFFAGDLGQRIFRQPFSWTTLGVDVRGRSHILKVNYRTSHQIREMADRLLPKVVRDVDGLEEDRAGTVSVFNGPVPVISRHSTTEEEIAAVAKFIGDAVANGVAASEISIFVRSRDQLDRARAATAPDVLDEDKHPLPQIEELVGAGWPVRKDRLARAILTLALKQRAASILRMGASQRVLTSKSRNIIIFSRTHTSRAFMFRTKRSIFRSTARS